MLRTLCFAHRQPRAGSLPLRPIADLSPRLTAQGSAGVSWLLSLGLLGGLWAWNPAQASQVVAATPPVADGASLRNDLNLLLLVFSGALVFFMQAGFALLESGMSRAKNAVNVLMKNYCDMCFGAIAYWAVGFGLMFGLNATGWLGSSHFLGMGVSERDYAALFFQTMFAATAATIVSGAIAERTRFGPYVLGSIVITAVIYPIFGAWAWGSLYGGQGWLRAMGFIDFAGSSVVHAVGGWAALAALIVVGPRLGRFGPRGEVRPILGHNLTSAALGALILWIGWFGFNAGSALALQASIGKVVLNTHLGGAAGAVGGLLWMALTRQPLLISHTLNASIAGLVSVTAGCLVMDPPFAILTGMVAGILCIWVARLLEKLRIDDVVGAVSVHVVGGVWGTLAAGLFVSGRLFDAHQLGVQALGVGVAFGWSFGSAWLLYTLLSKTWGLRASTLDEQRGLDYTEHYEVGYPEFQQELVHRGKGVD